MKQGLRCIVIDDHPTIRLALQIILDKAGYQVVAESGSGEEGLKLICELQPDIVLLDINLPDINGLTLMERLATYQLPCRLIILSEVKELHFAARVRALGGWAYLHKSESLDQLVMVIRLVISGYSYFSDQVFAICDKHYKEGISRPMLESLSEREFMVFRLLVKGYSNKEISEQLSLSHKTISTYRTRIFEKLCISTLAELVEIANRENYLGKYSDVN
ncbi:response regulator [Aeromonas hydrophila]